MDELRLYCPGVGGYGQCCAVAVACEVITERWTPLVVRELLSGSNRFNELRRGLPSMSPSLLSKRLRALERAGVVERLTDDLGGVEYRLTPAGADLQPVIEALGVWGKRWGHGLLDATGNLDASLLMREIQRNVIAENLPQQRVVVHFELRGSTDERSRYWLVLDRPIVELRLTDPPLDVDMHVEAHVRTMTRYWLGLVEFGEAVRNGDLRLTGPRELVRVFPTWFARSHFAPVAPAIAAR